MAGKVLIVDDDITLRDMYAERLKAEGFEAEIAGNGDEGIEKAKSTQPDVILLDIMMPKTNGFNALEELKRDEATKNIPVIMLTALIQNENKAR
ncbi:MAG: response regulator, partial [Candidatus Berkelbacteria bacterium]|nr:response regulator [Candidatus Berkelbacteria bacterium]